MALSTQVQESLKDAESSLRNALAFAARNERPMVCNVIATMISELNTVMNVDDMLDRLEERQSKQNG